MNCSNILASNQGGIPINLKHLKSVLGVQMVFIIIQKVQMHAYFASVAKKEGYEQMSALFLKTADNEKEHAKMWFKELAGIGDTKENLAAAAEGNHVHVVVGETKHPMLEEHFIEWITLNTNQGIYRKQLNPGQEPVADFCLCDGEYLEEVYAYCNLHGVWKC